MRAVAHHRRRALSPTSCARRSPSCRYEFVAAVLVGGKEKLRGGEGYGVPLAAGLEAGDRRARARGRRRPLRRAGARAARALPARSAGACARPPVRRGRLPARPARVRADRRAGDRRRRNGQARRQDGGDGKLARLAAEGRDVVVVSMGRGGPPEPEVVERPPTVDELVARSRAGVHAASDYLETAVTAGVVTVGCRRCGGGLAGDTWVSNVLEGLSLAEARGPELVICDGSGAVVPPVAADARMLVASALQGADLVTGYLNAYRIMVSDLVVLTMAGEDAGEIHRRIEEVKRVPVIACDLRLRPLEPLARAPHGRLHGRPRGNGPPRRRGRPRVREPRRPRRAAGGARGRRRRGLPRRDQGSGHRRGGGDGPRAGTPRWSSPTTSRCRARESPISRPSCGRSSRQSCGSVPRHERARRRTSRRTRRPCLRVR